MVIEKDKEKKNQNKRWEALDFRDRKPVVRPSLISYIKVDCNISNVFLECFFNIINYFTGER